MFFHFKFSILLFPALLWGTCYCFSIFNTCYKPFPKFADPSEVDSKKITDDINWSYDHFSTPFIGFFPILERFVSGMSEDDKADVDFFLYTQDNLDKPDHLDRTSLNESHFNPENPIKVLIHSFLPTKNFSDGAINSLKHAFLTKDKYNVIVLDYKSIFDKPYPKALKSSFLVAKTAGEELNFILKHFKLTGKQMHLIGIGFGGQLAGNIGNHIPELGRISAIDPAGALFDKLPDKYRLSPDDATFVDVIHTSAQKFPKGLGIPDPIGDQDYYPNGGEQQPGCKNITTAKEAGSQDAADFKNALCHHKRAAEYYMESICDTICSFTARGCDSYKKYVNWGCLLYNSPSGSMGFYAEKSNDIKPRSKFYLYTNEDYKYCKLV